MYTKFMIIAISVVFLSACGVKESDQDESSTCNLSIASEENVVDPSNNDVVTSATESKEKEYEKDEFTGFRPKYERPIVTPIPGVPDEWYEDGHIVYPVKYGEMAWKEAGFEDRWDMCTIPEKLLESMSTQELLNLILDYPDLYILGFDIPSPYRSFDRFREKFNGLHDYFEREDYIDVLISTYEKCETADYISSNEIDRSCGEYWIMRKFQMLEIMLSQPEVQVSLSDDEKELVIRLAEDKLAQRLEWKVFKKNPGKDELLCGCYALLGRSDELDYLFRPDADPA